MRSEGMARDKVSTDEYLRILNETLTHHPAYSDGMAFQDILPEGSHSYEIVVPASVPDRVRAGHVFDAVANEVRRRYVCARAASPGDDEETETSGSG
jgi:hypothetical protein